MAEGTERPGIPRLYTTAEVAEILGVSAKTVRALITSGRLGAVRVVSEYRITEEQLQTYIDENKV